MDQLQPLEHELRMISAMRTQLNQMAAASQVLEHNVTDEKGSSYLAVMNQSICRMLRIVGRMELSQRLSGQAPLSFAPVRCDFAPRLEELCHQLAGILGEIGIRLEPECAPRLPVRADLRLLEQLVLELVSCLALAGNHITLSAVARGGTLCLTLKDTGPGEAEGRAPLPRALERREEDESIALARQIARLHSGTLMCTAGENDRLTITLSIPLDEAPASTLESPRAVWNSGGFDPALVAMSELLPARCFRSLYQ